MKHFNSGQTINQGYYTSFQPDFINRQWLLDDMEIMQLLGQADRELGKLDMYSNYIPNIDLFISMHALKEATQSSKIEGTQTNIEDALLEEDDVPIDKRDDWEEIQNYIKAIDFSVKELEILPFSSRLIKEAHKVLMHGVRGEKKQPGEFRTSQNWIGGASINDASFIPPEPSSVSELMSDLERFVHNEKFHFPELLKIALIHYQFETIHPFLDGNGRVGRLMIPLYLISKNILQKPILYFSDFLERNRNHYYDNLTKVREKSDLTQWFKFFLVGIIETAQSGIRTFDNILQLQQQVNTKIQTLGSKAANGHKLINYLYQRPLIEAETASRVVGIALSSSYSLLKSLENLEILTETTGAQRGRRYVFSKYLSLFT
jgi:Fic family protein